MPSYPFIIQSSKSLDRESKKHVRQHASRFSNAQRRALSQRDAHRPLIIAPSRKNSAYSTASEQEEPREQQHDRQQSPNPSDSSEDYEEECGCASHAVAHPPRRDKRRTHPSGQLTGTAAEFCTITGIPTHMMVKLFRGYQDFTTFYSIDKNSVNPAFSPFSGYLNLVAYHDPLWLTACCLNSFVKFRVLRENDAPDENEVEVLQCKALALQQIQKTIKTAKANLDDLTIMSAIFLMTFEIFSAETPEDHVTIKKHFRGIETLVELRGGPKKIATTPFGQFIVDGASIYYLIYGVKENTAPLRRDDSPPQLRTDAVSFVDQPYYCFSPILRAASTDDPEYVLQYAPSVIPFLVTLNAAWELLFLEYHSAPDSLNRLTFKASRQQFQLPPEPVVEPTGNARDNALSVKLARACYLAGRIFHRAIKSLTPFADDINQVDVNELYTLMKAVDLSAWSWMPYIYVWVAMIGVSSCTTIRNKRYFCLQLSRSSILFGGVGCPVSRQMLLNFLWLQKILRGEVEPVDSRIS